MNARAGKPEIEAMAHQPLLVPHAALAPDPQQPRRTGADRGLDVLVESIKARGIIQPILVRPHPEPGARATTPYMIVVGERRWRAAARAGRDEVPVFFLDKPLSPAELLMLQLEENDGENRQELTLYDLARAVARAFQLEGVSQAQFAQRHRRSVSWISYLLSLSRAEGATAEAIREGHLRGVIVAKTFQRLAPDQQRELLARARRDGGPISLAAAEKMAGRSDRRPRSASSASERQPQSAAAEPAPPEPSSAADSVAPVLVYRSAAIPSPATSSAAGSSSRTAAPDGSRPPGAAPSPREAPAPLLPRPTRSAAAGLLAAAEPITLPGEPAEPGSSPEGETSITIELSFGQLRTLLRLLGQEPAATLRALVDQLMTCL
ncbi:MAG TPA: ParB/RepB/Spo0J family partition protein [Thermoanaerobaculia bacterium]|jgi:ParB family chromosome partitioning protein|nr:ParB/RepB/Spo0J family partition protein [Thermoanaerobaculia bacterium]